MVEQARIRKAFVKLGTLLRKFCKNQNSSEEHLASLGKAVRQSQHINPWFTAENLLFSLAQWGTALTDEKLEEWLSHYKMTHSPKSKTIGIIMAGNIPLVGFHDFLSVVLTGHKALCKLSSNDHLLLPVLTEYLIQIEPLFEDRISFTEAKLENFDAIIATGSNNTSRYFEYYFGKYPHVIRKNRTSISILSGRETPEQLYALGQDIFRYFGLGCRNVSKIFVPKDYDFDALFNSIYAFKSVIDHHKYANNYDYNKAVYLMSEFKILDNGFLILKEDETLHSPIAALFFEHYDTLASLKIRLEVEKQNLQCIVTDMHLENSVPFGQTQSPKLNEYADGIDTVDFLLKL